MQIRPFFPLLALSVALALGPPRQSSAADPPMAVASVLSLNAADPLGDSAALQAVLKATNEEWSIIYPGLQRIAALREQVNPTAATGDGTVSQRSFLNSPLGGTSMDAPTMLNNNGSRRMSGRSNPFDPKNAPGASSSGTSILGVLVGGLGRAIGNSFKPTQGNSVLAQLSDLKTLIETKETTNNQLWEKLAAIRAARVKAARDLDDAQKDLMLLLTTDQIATLVTLGCLD